MKKFILPVLLFLMFIPFYVNAETCDTDKITIENIIIENKSNNVEELDKANASGKSINLNLSMSEVGDNIEYKFVVKNDSNEDYELDKTSLNINFDYINYSFETEDNTNIVKANSSKNVTLRIEYKNEVPEDKFRSGSYNDSKTMMVQLSNGNTINVPDTFKNPNTGVQSYILVILILLLISGSLYVLLKKKKCTKFMTLVIGTVIIIPMSVYALCKCEIKIESNVEITKITNQGTLVEQTDNVSYTFGKKINRQRFESIKILTSNKVPENVLDSWDASIEQNGSIMAWYLDEDNDSYPELFIGQEGGVVANPNSSYMFYNFLRISKIDVSNLKTSNVTNMSWMFSLMGTQSETVELIGLENFNTSKVTSMTHMFTSIGYQNATNVIISDLSNFDVSNVTDMSYMFYCIGVNSTIFTLRGLENWDVSNVEDMSWMFSSSGESSQSWNIGDLSNWNTKNVSNMKSMFYQAGRGASSFNNIGKLEIYADNVNGMFYNCPAIITLNIYNNPSDYQFLFDRAAIKDYSTITMNYSRTVTNIDSMYYTKSLLSRVIKGNILD